jgi:hypothetical protein
MKGKEKIGEESR